MSAREQGEALPERSVILTFHDQSLGWSTLVAPLLRELEIKAHFLPVILQTSEEDTEYSTGWASFRELMAARNRSGERLFHLGTHTFGHDSMRRTAGESSAEYRARLRRELAGTAAVMEERTGERPTFFALPFGYGFSDAHERRTIREIAESEGYRAGQSGRYYDADDFWLGGVSLHDLWATPLELEFALSYASHESCLSDFALWFPTAVNRGLQRAWLSVF